MPWFVRDLQFAIRKFWHAPGLTLTAIVTLTLGIGANTAIFSLVDGAWLRPLPIRDPAHLVSIQSVKESAAADSERDTGSSFAEFEDLQRSVRAFSAMAATSGRGVVLDQNGNLRLLLARVVSENYFSVMGASAQIGRLPTEQEMREAKTPLVVLGNAAWKDIFGGEPKVIGTDVKVTQGMAHIAAVLPPGFRGMDRMIDPQIYVSRTGWLTWNPRDRQVPRTNRDFDLYARLRPGATLAEAREQLGVAAAQLAAAYPAASTGRGFKANWEAKSADRQIKMLSLLLLAIAGAVLLIACANIVNLLLALNDARRHEIAMCVALGASHLQLARQIVTEYCGLAAVSIGSAVFLARRLIGLVPALLPNIGYPLGFDFRIDVRVLTFTAATGLVSVLVCGLLPALASSQVSPLEATPVQVTARGRVRMPARKVFVVAQLAISMALLTVTALLVRTLVHIETMDIGFNRTQKMLLLDVAVGREGPAKLAEFATLAERMRGLPGVRDATVARVVPFPDNGGGATQVVLSPGEAPSPTAGISVWFNWVDDAYFRVMGVPLLSGRPFYRRDTVAGERVIIVNQTLARKLFGSEDAVGRHVRIGRDKPVDTEIVGVARDGKYGDVTETAQPYLYLPLTQNAWSEVTVIAATAGDPGTMTTAARKVVRDVDSRAVILSMQTLTDHLQMATYPNRVVAWLTASLGGLALFLTAIGLYGIMAYSVARRTRELGIRIAVGAQRGTLFAAVLREGLKLTLGGLALGTGLAILLGRAMSAMLYGVTYLDPAAFLTVTAMLLAVSFAALVVPARRTLQANPVDALREE